MIETMGLTETCAPILSNPPVPSKIKYGSPGIAYGNEVMIFDKNFNENHLIGMGINAKTQDDKFYNTFSFYDSNLNLIDSYRKVDLVPFGEFLPFENFFKKFEKKRERKIRNKEKKIQKVNHKMAQIGAKIDNVSN